MSLKHSKARRASHAVVSGVGAALLSLMLAACDHSRQDNELYVALSDPAKRHPIVVTPTRAQVDLMVPRDPAALGVDFRPEAVRFLRSYQKEGEGPLTVAVPPGARSDPAVRHALHRLHEWAGQAGVSSARIEVRSAAGLPRETPVLTLAYNRYTALGPDCGDWSEDVARNRQTLPYPNFGCAVQRNLAAMIANPDDYNHPRMETPRSSERRSVTWKKYISGTKSGGGGEGEQGEGANSGNKATSPKAQSQQP